MATEQRLVTDVAALELHPRVSVSGVSTIGWSLDQDIDFWGSSGIRLVGVLLHKLAPFGLEAAVERLAAADIRVSNLVGPMGLSVGDPGRWEAEQAVLIGAVDDAVALGSPCVCTLPGPPGPLDSDAARRAFATAVAPVRDYAAGQGVAIAVEHVNALRRDIGFVHTLGDAVDMAAETGTSICVELNNAWVEMHLHETFTRGVDAFALVQVSDFVVGTTDVPNRAVPGDGDINIERLLGALLDAGYDGPFDLELIGPRIETEGYGPAVRRGVAWLSDTLDRLGA